MENTRAIIRIVRMVFKKEAVTAFEELFTEKQDRIRHFKGCRHLELWRDENEHNVYFTYSIWEDEASLDQYRFSGFFKETWSITKTLFLDKPQAWTLKQFHQGI